MATMAVALPAPLVRLRLRTAHIWLWHKLQLLIWAAVLAYIGMLFFAGLYYLVTQVNPTMNHLWHTVVANDVWRHNIRDRGEGLLGGLLGQQAIWNHYRRRRPLSRLDHWEIRHHIANVKDDKPLSFGQLLASPALVLIYAIPGFLLGTVVAWLIHHYGGHLNGMGAWVQQATQVGPSPVSSVTKRLEGLVTNNWDQKLQGYGAAFFLGRRPAKGVFDDLQLAAVELMRDLHLPMPRFLPPTLRARYNDVAQHGVPADQQHRGWWWKLALWPTLVGFMAMVGFGAYVLLAIAPS